MLLKGESGLLDRPLLRAFDSNCYYEMPFLSLLFSVFSVLCMGLVNELKVLQFPRGNRILGSVPLEPGANGTTHMRSLFKSESHTKRVGWCFVSQSLTICRTSLEG